MNEKRKAEDYEIIYEMCIGEKEIVVGEKSTDENDKYMCAFYKDNGIIAEYSEVLLSDSYPEIISIFAQRIKDSADKHKEYIENMNVPESDKKPIDKSYIIPISYTDDIDNKVIVIKPEILRREYKTAVYQLKLCTGGFGSKGNGRGRMCFCKDLFTGKNEQFQRSDIEGVMNIDKIPDWAQKTLDKISHERESRGNSYER